MMDDAFALMRGELPAANRILKRLGPLSRHPGRARRSREVGASRKPDDPT